MFRDKQPLIVCFRNCPSWPWIFAADVVLCSKSSFTFFQATIVTQVLVWTAGRATTTKMDINVNVRCFISVRIARLKVHFVSYTFCSTIRSSWQRWANCKIFQSESSPDPIKLNPIQPWSAKFLKIISPIQSWSAHVKSGIFILSHEEKELLELFSLQPNTIGWRQNSSSSAFPHWGKIDTVFWHGQGLTSKCLFGIRGISLLELFCHHENPIDRIGQVTRTTQLD